MAKGSQKRSPRYKKDQLGCMGGLISIFDFRQGRSMRRLISDMEHGHGRQDAGASHSTDKLHLLTNGDVKHENMDANIHHLSDKSKSIKTESGKPSVKALMDEEMSKVQLSKKKIPTAALEQIGADLKLEGWSEKNHKQMNKTSKVVCNQHCLDLGASASLEPQQTYPPNSMEIISAMAMFYRENYPCQEEHLDHKNENDSVQAQKRISDVKGDRLNALDMQLVQKNVFLEQKLGKAMKAVLDQKFVDARLLSQDGSLHQSKEFIEALELLNSNEELFLKLLQDPNSLLVRHIEDLWNAQPEKPSRVDSCKLSTGAELPEEINSSRNSEELVGNKLFHKPSMNNLFRRKDKPQGSNPSNRIVVLKPGPAVVQNSSTLTSASSSPLSHHSFGNERESESVISHFSLREIKRRLKHAIGESKKERNRISKDGFLHRIPYGHHDSRDNGNGTHGENVNKDLESKTSIQSERASKVTIGSNRKNKKMNLKECQSSTENDVFPSTSNNKNVDMKTSVHSHKRESTIYEDARRHLAEMLKIGDEDEDLVIRQVPRPLGRILSLPEYNMLSPILSPTRNNEPGFVPEEVRLSPRRKFRSSSEGIWHFRQDSFTNRLSPLGQNSASSNGINSDKADDELQLSNLSSEHTRESLPDNGSQESICVGGDSSPKDIVEIIAIRDIVCVEDDKVLDVPSESATVRTTSNTNSTTDETERCEEERSSEFSKLDASEEKAQLASPATPIPTNPVLAHEIEAPEGIGEKLERPSPISVLEPFFTEDVNSPPGSVAQYAALSMLPRISFEEENTAAPRVTYSGPEINLRTCTADKESIFEYVRTVMEASGFSCNEFKGRWHAIDQPLDQSLFEEIDASSGQFSDDSKLLFDCINEVLMEVYEQYFSCSPWVSYVKPDIRPIPVGHSVMQEVWRGIDWYLLPQLPRTLDQIVEKDMIRVGTWMDLRAEIESIIREGEEVILEELIEETLLELWN